jgi:Zinc dependent phospholipase C
VPTPFYHLSLAEELINHHDLPEPIRHFLRAYRNEFLFGSTAPDVQVVSGQRREATHFFDLPIQPGDLPAWEGFLNVYPELTISNTLPGGQSAFLAGYLCHLQADWVWVKDIFSPVFGPHSDWGTFKQRLYYHNVLRAYLDWQILPGLPGNTGTNLSEVEPRGYLPFVKDQSLTEWRDLLARQLHPGATIQTVEVFSSRQGISAPEYYAVLASAERMQSEVFEHLPLERVDRYRAQVLKDNLRLLANALAFRLHPIDQSPERLVIKGVNNEID